MPTLHNPLGWVMGAPARARMIEIARRHGSLIIEDASYAFLVEEPPPPLAALAPEITVYVSGLSKSVATGLRVGFVAAPAPFVPAIERAIRATTWNTPVIMTAIACRWLEDGTVGRLEAAKRDDASSAAVDRPRHPGGPAADRPPVVVLRLAAAARGGTRGPDSGVAGARAHLGRHRRTLRDLHAAPQAIRLALGSTDIRNLRTTLSKVRQVVGADAYS